LFQNTHVSPMTQICLKTQTVTDKPCVNTTPIANCHTMICPYIQTAAATMECSMCNNKFSLSLTSNNPINQNGSKTCATATGAAEIANCESYMSLLAVSAAVKKNACYSCKANFAVANDKKTCKAFTKDTHCRFVDSLGTGCEGCKENYHFGGTTCVLSSNLIGLAFVALAALFFA